jgi:protein required for attachment to host cells
MADPRRSGIGRALFISLSDQQVREYSLPLGVGTSAWIDAKPCVRRLLCVHERSRAAGVVVADGRHLTVYEWRAGSMEAVTGVERRSSLDTDDPPNNALRAPAGRDQLQVAERIEIERWEEEAAALACREASDRQWREMVIVGEARLRAALAQKCPASLAVVDVAANHAHTPLDRLADEITHVLASERASMASEQVHQLLETAEVAGSLAAIGPAHVLACLSQGRVDTLYYDTDAQLHMGEDGMGILKSTPDEAGDGYHGIERLVEQALATRARVVVVNGQAGEALQSRGSVAARLRW